jgi:DNA phosphorothioation-dependent restriction protein DptG
MSDDERVFTAFNQVHQAHDAEIATQPYWRAWRYFLEGAAWKSREQEALAGMTFDEWFAESHAWMAQHEHDPGMANLVHATRSTAREAWEAGRSALQNRDRVHNSGTEAVSEAVKPQPHPGDWVRNTATNDYTNQLSRI